MTGWLTKAMSGRECVSRRMTPSELDLSYLSPLRCGREFPASSASIVLGSGGTFPLPSIDGMEGQPVLEDEAQ